MPLGQFGQIAFPVTDVDRSERFYEHSLGLNKLFRFGQLVFFDCAGIRLMLEGRAEIPSADGACHYFRVNAIDPVVAELKAKGVVFESEPHLIAKMPDHELWMAFFRDPDARLLALMEERRP